MTEEFSKRGEAGAEMVHWTPKKIAKHFPQVRSVLLKYFAELLKLVETYQGDVIKVDRCVREVLMPFSLLVMRFWYYLRVLMM